MLVNCYETPYILLISRGKTAKKRLCFWCFLPFLGEKNLHLRMNGKCELNGTQHNLLTYVV